MFFDTRKVNYFRDFILAYLLFFVFVFLYGVASLSVRSGVGRGWAMLFIGWWGLLLAVSVTNPFDLYEVSSNSYFLFCLFVCFYFFGFAVFFQRKKLDVDGLINKSLCDYKRLVNNHYFKFFLVLFSLVLLSYAYKYAQYIAVAGSLDSRVARFEIGKVFDSAYEIVLFDYFIGGLIWILKFIVAFGVVFSASRNFVWVLSFISCALYMSFGAGRNIAIEIGLLIVFLVMLGSYSNSLVKKSVNKYKVVLFLVVLYIASVFATFSRMSDGSISLEEFVEANLILLEHAAVYSVGSFRAFDYAYANYQNLLSLNFGLLTASGFDEVFSLGLRFLGGDVVPYSNYWGGVLAQPIPIGSHHEFNALYTALFNFYFDFGFVGVVFNGFLFGAVCSKILNLSIRKGGGEPSFCFQYAFCDITIKQSHLEIIFRICCFGVGRWLGAWINCAFKV